LSNAGWAWLGWLAPFRRSPDAALQQADPARLRRMQWQVFIAITLGYGFFYVCRLSLNVIKKPLIDAGVLDPAQLGMIGSALFFTYAGARLLHGVLVDHAHLRRFMALGLLASAAINLELGSLPGFWVFVVLWGANGLFQAMGAPASIVSIANWFPLRGRGTVYGVWSTSHNIGEAFTYVVTAAIVTSFGAAWGMRAAGLIGVAAGLMILLLLHERPEVQGLPAPQAAVAADASTAAPASVAAAQWRAVRTPGVWLLALASGFFYVTRYAINSWGVFFLQEHKGYSALQAASIISASAIAGIAGTFFSGIVADRLFGGRRHVPALIFGLLYIAATALFVLGPPSAVLDTATMVLFGVAMGALLAYLGGMMAIDLVDKSAVGTATGIVGVASYLGAAIQDLVSGQLIHAGKTMVDGRAHYDFALAGWLWIGAAVLSCLLALLVWPKAAGTAARCA
jgi:OPA family sugar phosphate sensor protein UhpC-like MFS transporter